MQFEFYTSRLAVYAVLRSENHFNTLKPNDRYTVYHLLYRQITLHFTFVGRA
jgi:hypothetical protein